MHLATCKFELCIFIISHLSLEPILPYKICAANENRPANGLFHIYFYFLCMSFFCSFFYHYACMIHQYCDSMVIDEERKKNRYAKYERVELHMLKTHRIKWAWNLITTMMKTQEKNENQTNNRLRQNWIFSGFAVSNETLLLAKRLFKNKNARDKTVENQCNGFVICWARLWFIEFPKSDWLSHPRLKQDGYLLLIPSLQSLQ